MDPRKPEAVQERVGVVAMRGLDRGNIDPGSVWGGGSV